MYYCTIHFTLNINTFFMKTNKLTEEFKPKIIELYVDKMYGASKVSDILNIPVNQIRQFLREENLTRSPGTTKLYTCNEAYFHEIDKEHKAYWLGVLYADGNVSKECATHSGHIILSSKDTSWIELFKKGIRYNGKTYQETHNVFKKTISKVKINSDSMFSDLCEIGCIPAKSLIIRIPAIPQNLIRHFIRGYFDGDGTVGIYRNTPKGTTKVLRSGFCSGSREFLEAITCYLPTNMRTVKKASNRNLFQIMFSTNDSIALYEYLYSDSTIWLDRKRKKFEEFLQEKRSETIIEQSSLED